MCIVYKDHRKKAALLTQNTEQSAEDVCIVYKDHRSEKKLPFRLRTQSRVQKMCAARAF